jgi:drug/metabolite transporter (DMT)-like permease
MEISKTGPARPAVPRRLLADLALLFVTLIWGSTFVMVKDAVATYPVFSFLALRFACAALALLPFVIWQRAGGRGHAFAHGTREMPAASWGWLVAPLLIGVASFAGYGFQTAGLQLTTPAKAGFITGLYIVLVPLAAGLALKQKPGLGAWLGVAAALVGLALLSLRPGLQIAAGDALVFGCAVAFAAHILLTGRYAPNYDPLLLTLGQIVVVALLSGAIAVLTETRPALTPGIIFAAVFTGVLATSLAFGIQTVAQRATSATHTALIFSAEPVFAALASLILIGEVLGPRQILGCALILVGMLVAELVKS